MGDKDLTEKVSVESFVWSVYDVDFRSAGQQERLIMDTTGVRYYIRDPSEVQIYCEGDDPLAPNITGTFQYSAGEGPVGKNITNYGHKKCPDGQRTVFHSTTHGSGGDNPQDPHPLNMTLQQKARAIDFVFENTACWTFTYEHYCPCGKDYCLTEGGGGDQCNQWCRPENQNRCKSYSGGNFVFSGGSTDRKIRCQ